MNDRTTCRLASVLAARHRSNSIGWIFCGLGVVAGVLALSTEYVRWALIDQGDGTSRIGEGTTVAGRVPASEVVR